MTIPLWLVIGLVALGVLLFIGVILWLRLQRRWIRVRAIIFLSTLYLSVPAITIAAKAYGIEFSIGEANWPASIVAVIGILCLYHIEMVVQKSEVSNQLLHEFQIVIERQVKDGISVEKVAKELEVPKARVIDVLRCIDEVTQLLSQKG